MVRSLLLASVLTAASLTGALAQSATLVVRADGIKSAEGSVFVGVCNKSLEERECPFGDRKPARAGTVEFRIPNVPPGRYAVAVYHDANGNGRLDRSAIGFPQEPYGFSNDIGRTSIPTFNAALVTVNAPTSTITVPVR
jgi:uncharacterized protein (DUF2141 family)